MTDTIRSIIERIEARNEDFLHACRVVKMTDLQRLLLAQKCAGETGEDARAALAILDDSSPVNDPGPDTYRRVPDPTEASDA